MVKVHMDSNWTVQSSGLQWTPVHFSHRQSRYKLAVKKVDWSPVESSGVHMEYGGTVKTSMFELTKMNMSQTGMSFISVYAHGLIHISRVQAP